MGGSNRPILFAIGGIVVGIGAGVAIGWFSKPESDINDSPSSRSNELINEFIGLVEPDRLGSNLQKISAKPHYATSVGDNELAEMVRDQWAKTLDDAWIVDYTIMHQWPRPENSFAVLKQNGQDDYVMAQKEDIDEDDVLMFYNAFSPPTGFDIDDDGNAIDTKITTNKLVYGHYCNQDNVNELLAIDEKIFVDAIVLCKYTNGGRPDKCASVKPHGALAVLQFSDPFDYSHGEETGFPNDAGIPWDTVQRGSSKYLRGDPTTPGYPSYPGVYERSIKDLLKITKEERHGPHIWAPLPQQPINIKDTQHLISKLTGSDIPDSWKTQSGFELGGIGGQLPSGMSFELQISPTYERGTSPDVIGFLEGSEYPDEYVFVGNHRDSWIHGTLDPSSGTTTLFEVSEVLSSMKYRPKRSIVFCSWGSEEHGLIGSEEFVEEFYSIIQERAVAYINADVSFQANVYFKALATPVLQELVYDVTQMVPDHEDKSKTAYDVYLEYEPNSDSSRPVIGLGGVGSDYAPFQHTVGVPIIDVGFVQKNRSVPIYSTYHTAYDNFEYASKWIDPGFKGAGTVTSIVGGFIIKLGESDSIPVKADGTISLVESYQNAITDDMKKHMADGQMEALDLAINNFKAAIQNLADQYSKDNSHRAQQRLLNQNKHLINSMCCHPIQIDLKNVLTSPRQEKGPVTFPGLSDYYQFVANPNLWSSKTEIEKIQEYQLQVTALLTTFNKAADYLNMEKPFNLRSRK